MNKYKKELMFILYVYLFIVLGGFIMSPLYIFAHTGYIHSLWFLLLSMPIGGLCIAKTVSCIYEKEIKPNL